MQIQFSLITSLIFIFSVLACTQSTDYVPEYSKYIEDTELMLNISNKFTFEPDVKKLNKVAVATQQARVLSCADFNGECDLYGKFISNVIELSQDGVLAPEERKQLEIEMKQLGAAIKQGRSKLKLLRH